ncbi:MAG: 16S rRNA (guanine(966)-N(2))-methyltransferase RsmD [Bacillota bacterium]
MRIIAGTAKGREILTPKGRNTRPTLGRVKESLFGILQFSLDGARVLDLYAGSGSLGLEALSRGAAFAVFNDMDRGCCELISKNIDSLGFTGQASVMQMDALSAIARLAGGQAFDIAFLDPPYRMGAQQAIEELFRAGLVAPGGRVIVEHAWEDAPHTLGEQMICADVRKYGDTGLSFFFAGNTNDNNEET